MRFKARSVVVEQLEDRSLFSVPGISVQTYPIPQGTNFPGNLSVTADGNVWYTSGLSPFVGFVAPDGTVAAPISTASASSHGLDGLTVGKDGNVWFCELFDHVIGTARSDGTVLSYTYANPNKFGGPNSITLGPDGHLWITTFFNYVGRVNKVVNGLAKISWFHHRGEGLKQIVSFNNALYIRLTDRIQRIGRSGFFNGVFKMPSGGTLADMSIGPDGNLWFTENAGTSDLVGYVNKKGKVIEHPVDKTEGDLAGISRTASGNLVFAQGEFLQEVDTTGVLLASQDLGLASGAGSVREALDGNVWFAEGVAGKIGLATV